MNETDKIIAAMLNDCRAAFIDKKWKELSKICETLADFSKELSQLQKDKIVYYKNQSREDLQ